MEGTLALSAGRLGGELPAARVLRRDPPGGREETGSTLGLPLARSDCLGGSVRALFFITFMTFIAIPACQAAAVQRLDMQARSSLRARHRLRSRTEGQHSICKYYE